ncbi:MAG: anaerobic glycerol-3-phosphate dehydrogenase subunit B [Hyphomicrobiales bacterium]|nr:MAG: anaerobic glycerol-3-phosphate dehydrogenase subunit B [Hyphomicrobiales bacterium]
MIREPRHLKTRLAVIGSGIAGFAASIFALERGIATAQVGNTGAIAYTSGYFDLLGISGGKLVEDPFAGLAELREAEPGHPLSRISDEDIRAAFAAFTKAITEMGIGYSEPDNANHRALLPAGTAKPTYAVPRTMVAGIEAYAAGTPTVIVDFVGLQGFSANEMVSNLKADWPALSAAHIGFPDMDSGVQVFPEVMARALEVPATREQLAERLRAVAGDAEAIGLPAMTGIHLPDKVHGELERLVGLPIFEIPTMPPAVPGIRLREMFEQKLPERGLQLVSQQTVEHLTLGETGITLALHDAYGDVTIEAEAVLLATGRFLSGGLDAGRDRIRETLLDLPVEQPEAREDWHSRQYFDPNGHAINRAGLVVDDHFRPLGHDGTIVDPRLYAAGIVLARQDWVRQRCGAGVAIASAYRAVASIAEDLAAEA